MVKIFIVRVWTDSQGTETLHDLKVEFILSKNLLIVKDTDGENKRMETGAWQEEMGVGWTARLGLTYIYYWYYV